MHNRTIVNVDDHEPARYARHRILETAGYKVYDGSTGKSAIELVEHHRPALVLLDVHLPDMNGMEVCRQLKAGPHAASILVLQISASALSGRSARIAMDNGADGYLTDPVDPDVLISTVRALLRLRAAEQSLAITNQRLEKMIARLERSNADLRQFAQLASHEMRAPLRGMETSLALLMEQGQLAGPARQHAASLQNGAARMDALLTGIVALSEANKNPFTIGPVDLSTAVPEAVNNLSKRINESRASVDYRDDSHGASMIEGDSAQIVRMLEHLIDNAIKYRKNAPPRVLVKLEAGPERDCLLSVTDNGAGIPEAERDDLFDLFPRLHGDPPSAAIGLAVCRRIVDLHGGRIWAESPEGGGTRVMISLPAQS
jgi:signal transduction histidine kinase